MSQPPNYTVSNVARHMRPPPSDRPNPASTGGSERKSAERDKNQEIESIKRTLYNALDRLEKLKKS